MAYKRTRSQAFAPSTLVFSQFKRPRTRTRYQTRYPTVYPPARAVTVVPRSFGTPRAITERKYFDTQLAAGAFVTGGGTSWAGGELDPTGGANTLFAPTTGDDFNNRTGRKVQVISIKIRGKISGAAQVTQSIADGATSFRILLVQDKQTNGTQLNAEDVLASGSATLALYQFQNPAFFGRFRVLKDKIITLQNPTMAPIIAAGPTYPNTVIQSGLSREFKMNVKFKKPVVVHFNGTNGGTVADIVDNSFHLIGLTNDTSILGVIDYKCRTVFLDQ